MRPGKATLVIYTSPVDNTNLECILSKYSHKYERN